MTKYNIRDKRPRQNRLTRRQPKQRFIPFPVFGPPRYRSVDDPEWMANTLARMIELRIWEKEAVVENVFKYLHRSLITMDQARALIVASEFTPAQFELYLRLS